MPEPRTIGVVERLLSRVLTDDAPATVQYGERKWCVLEDLLEQGSPHRACLPWQGNDPWEAFRHGGFIRGMSSATSDW